MDSNSRTLTATSCFSVVLVHERQFKLGFGEFRIECMGRFSIASRAVLERQNFGNSQLNNETREWGRQGLCSSGVLVNSTK